MHRPNRRVIAVVAAATSLGLACAADPGDPLKNTATGNLSGSSSSSSGGSSSGASTSSGGNGSGSGSGSGTNSSSSGSTSSSSGVGSSSSGTSSSSGASSTGSSSGVTVDAGVDAGPACAPMMNAPVNVGFCTNDSTPFTNSSMSFNLLLGNGSFSTVHLSDVKVRYWFNADQNPVATIFFVSDYSQNGGTAITTSVTGTFAAAPAANVTPTSDSYLEFSFGTMAGDLGVLGGSMANVQARIHGPGANGFSDMFVETNDYSFSPMPKCSGGNTGFTTTQNVTAYLKGQLVWGCEPGSGVVTSSSSSSSGGGADSGSDSTIMTRDAAGGG